MVLTLAAAYFSVAMTADEVTDDVVADGATPQATAPRLPVEAFFSDPEFSHPRLSPDGKHVALLYSSDSVQAIAVRPTVGSEFEFLGKLTEPEVRLAWLEWANSKRILFSVQTRSAVSIGVKSRVHKLVSVALDDDKVRMLGEQWKHRVQYQDQILHHLPDDPRHVLLEYRPSTSETPLVQRLDVKSGALAPVEAVHPEIHAWRADHDGVVRAGEGYDGLRYSLFARVAAKDKLKKVIEWNPYEDEGFYLAGFSYDPRTIYVSKVTAGRVGIFEYDLATRRLGDAVFADAEYDARNLIFDRQRRRLVAVDYLSDVPVRRYLDDEAALAQRSIDHALPGTVNEVVSRTDDGALQLVRVSSDVRPPEYYALSGEPGKRRLDFVLSLYPDLAEDDLVPMRPVTYAARDGLPIHAYLTVPKGRDPKNLPVVVLPHGGPTARDYRRFDPEVQLLANRGFAVFQMNFRGSSGYGEQHQALGYRQWGGTMQDDITDGVRWLIEQGIADPERVGIYGSSYGGYAALMGLATTPELFRAGASYAGVTDLPLLLAKSKWYQFHEHNRPTIGGGWGDRKRLRQASPVDLVEEIRAPVLLGHGVDDQAVDVKHSRDMARALRKADKDVTYLEFENEPHGLLLETNRVRFYTELVRFFEESLAPRPLAPNRQAANRQSGSID